MIMQNINKKNRFSWLISLAVMLVLSGLVILISDRVAAAVYAPYQESQPVDFTVSETVPAELPDNAEDYHVNSVELGYDADGNFVAYLVETWEYGFNAEKPITIRSTISADGTLLAEIKVVSQKESEYYGAQIKESYYTDRFTGRTLPLLLSSQSGRGSRVDGISGATYTSTAVMQAIDDANRFVTEQMMH
jgi:Na+-translocating ferredoxin:NAD+ oxidoreductase RnfG subunit